MVLFQVHEEEDAVPANRPAGMETRLAPCKVRIEIQRFPPQRRVSGQTVVAEKEKRAAMKTVPARPGNNVDGAHSRNAGRNIEVDGRDLEFLHQILRQIQRVLASDVIGNVAAIGGDARPLGGSAQNGYLELAVRAAAICRRQSDPGLEFCQLHKIPPIQGQLLDLHAGHHTRDAIAAVQTRMS